MPSENPVCRSPDPDVLLDRLQLAFEFRFMDILQSLIVVKKNMMLDTNTIENATIHCVQAMSSLFVLAFC